MNHPTDQQLLRDYAGCRSDAAFAELLRRHVDFVYSAALRMVCDRHLAEDVTQGVFVALAQNAGQLANRPVLSGWLHRTAQNLAANIVRSDVRRRAREQEAATMNELLSAESDIVWEQIAPQLDAALGELNEADRDAVLLRYFERKSAQEISQTLGISAETAQKRVSRAVERLREFFSKQKITIGASGLTVLISANAVQSAPMGLAATISTVAILTGTTVSTSTAITTTKIIAMTALQKSIIGAAVAVAVGTGIFEAHQVSQLRDQNQNFQQQQTSLSDQIRQLQRERDDATNQLASLLAENAQLKSNSNENELLKLRGEVTQLKTAKAQRENDPTDAAVRALMDKENQIKQYVEQHPNEKIPEFQFLDDRSWLTIAEGKFETTNDYQNAMQFLRFQAEGGFGSLVANALMKYSDANNRQFPTDLSQLQPYLDPAAEDMLTQLYTIAPASIVKDAPSKFVNGVRMSDSTPLNMIGNWIITRKIPTNPNSPSRFAIFTGGETYWQSSPSSDNQ